MNIQDLRDREFETTLHVLQAYPEDKSDLKPSEKSRTARELAMVLSVEEQVITGLIRTGATNPQTLRREVPETLAEIISSWRQAFSTNTDLIASLSQEQLDATVDFYGLKISLSEAIWFEMLDHIHHRGQFSVYLRMAGGKVPSIYGPTADMPS